VKSDKTGRLVSPGILAGSFGFYRRIEQVLKEIAPHLPYSFLCARILEMILHPLASFVRRSAVSTL